MHQITKIPMTVGDALVCVAGAAVFIAVLVMDHNADVLEEQQRCGVVAEHHYFDADCQAEGY